ncbi:efflux RND transporter permease subunit [Maritalea mobilis]|uniref:efflux RND transporter permease subunit n=1 Tax=Maritalea mobilis TaxID=483324 RepID=UPI001C96093A|nr:efflux RND transporter permease subunit [Maritalea mobilis]MBY6202629.1 efflux RND transporter permease subunit [Maritalea mobilis]
MRQLPPKASGILSYFTRHRTAANLLLVLLLVAGLAAIPQMRAQFFPDIVSDEIDIVVTWDGAGAEDVDEGIVAVLEPVLLAVPGVVGSESRSSEGRASMALEFEPGWDMSRAADEVQAALDGITDLPDDADEPDLRRGQWWDRVTDVVITGPVAPEQLGRFADEFVVRLFDVGVTATTIRGVAAPETVVEVPSSSLIQYDISMSEIATVIAAAADTSPAGDVDSANARIRTGTASRTAEQIANLTLRINDDGSSLTIGDVARIEVGGVNRERAYFVGDNPAISIRVDRSEDGDAIAIQHLVEDVAAELEATLPAGTEIDLIRTRAEAISGRLNTLLDNAGTGLALVVGLLFLFLNTRTALWVAAGIPVALTAAIALMWVAGLTINMISLFALIITLGIVVDDAIVVGEHADYRRRTLGEDPVTAAENAARRMAAPVFSATVTTVLAFAALTAIGGRFGDMIADIPFTVIVVLIASLVECFLILPNHMSHALKERQVTGFSRFRVGMAALALTLTTMVLTGFALLVGAMVLARFGVLETAASGLPAGIGAGFFGLAAALGFILLWGGFALLPKARKQRAIIAMSQNGIDSVSRMINTGFEWLRETLFRPLMRFVVWARYPILAATFLVLATQVGHFLRGDVTWRFFNAPELSSVSGNFAMLDGATREDSMAMMREMQRATEAVAARYEEEYGRNPLLYVLSEVGGNTGGGLSGVENKDTDLLGSIAIELIDADFRPYSAFQFVADLQDEVRQLPQTETVSFRGWRGGPGGDAIDVQIFGADTATLKQAAEAVQARLVIYPEVSALEDSMAYDREELSLELTPQGEALGFEIGELGRVMRNRLGGIEAATYPDGPRTAAIRVELPEGELTADFLDRVLLRAASGQYVPLADIVTVTARQGFSTIQRENGIRLISVTGDLSEDDPARAEEIMDELETVIIPEVEENYGVSTQLSGLAEQERDFLGDALTGFILCLVGIYLVLAWIFASWTRPLVVMAIIPFGLVGTIYGHLDWDVPLSMFTVVGLIGMTGIIINDSIVLVTTVDEYAQERGLIPAIIDGACDRLRPVMLTTLTTVLGLAPLLYETSRDAQFLKPTVITLVYGLSFGMVIVLLVVPAILAMQQDVGKQVTALRRALGAGSRRPLLALSTAALAATMLGWFTATMGAVIVTGRMAGPLAGLAAEGALMMPLAVFLGGVALLCLLAWIGAAIAHRLASRKPVSA